MLSPSLPQKDLHGPLSTAVLYCGLEKNGMFGAWHGHEQGKCESDTAAQFKSNVKDIF